MNNKKDYIKTNHQINFPEVRITGDDIESNVCSIQEAKRIANEAGLDLILMVENAKPPVCKIMDLNKYLYEIKKKAKEQEKKNRENRVEVKEMRFRPNIDDHDFNFKKNHIIRFLNDNNKVKCNVMYKGRELANIDAGKIVLLRMADEVGEYGVVESMPRMEGKKMFMIIKPLKAKR